MIYTFFRVHGIIKSINIYEVIGGVERNVYCRIGPWNCRHTLWNRRDRAERYWNA